MQAKHRRSIARNIERRAVAHLLAAIKIDQAEEKEGLDPNHSGAQAHRNAAEQLIESAKHLRLATITEDWNGITGTGDSADEQFDAGLGG